MRWLVTGCNGMLGQDMVSTLERSGYEAAGVDLPGVDITDAAAVAEAIAGAQVLVNCAAYTAVDAAEENEQLAFRVNAVGPQVLARACAQAGVRMVHISTDYVFDGVASQPYAESATLDPASAYGRTKAAGEWAVRSETDDFLIVRTAWLYGAHGNCFPKTIANAARSRGAVSVVTDQVGQPTWTQDLADLIVRLVEKGVPAGIYHGTSSGQCSWYEFTAQVLASAGIAATALSPTTSEGFVRPAPRPAFSVLDHGALTAAGVDPIGNWSDRWNAAAPDVLAHR